MMALGILSVGLKLRSTTAPVITFLILVRTKGRALAGLHVLEINDVPDATVPFDRNALFEIASGNHSVFPPFVLLHNIS
jgi:hypothetical protein